MGQSNGCVLVTGGAGFIGSHVCKALAKAGFAAITYDSLIQGHDWAVQWGPLEKKDIHDAKALDEVFLRYKPSCVIHLASHINVRESLSSPGKYYHNNVMGTLSLLDAMCRNSVKHLVFSSTAAIYGNPIYLPLDENHPKAPLNAYGKSKLVVEEILDDYARAHGISFAALRYFNAAGADLDGEIGEAHDPETHLIPLALFTALKRRPSLAIYGIDYPTPDGTAIRDYIHVCDLAKAHIQALNYLLSGGKSCKINLGTGKGFSVKEVIDAVKRMTGLEFPIEIAPKSPDSPALVADASQAKSLLQWAPQYSDLETMIETAWKWYEKCN